MTRPNPVAETNRAAREMTAQRRGGPPWAGMGMPAEKSLAFGPSARRLLRRLAPERFGVAAVVVLGVLSVALNSVGPLVLGHATDVIFAGVLGRQLQPGTSTEAAAAAAREAGNETYANVLEGAGVVPGRGIDFGLLGQVLLGVVMIYVAASLFGWRSK
jgi:ATP-binding cassette subfamily B protein